MPSNSRFKLYYEAPEPLPGVTDFPGVTDIVFLAGGITGCPDWQKDAIDYIRLNIKNVIIINPRRKGFDISDPRESMRQIRWEYEALTHFCWTKIFWFPKETLCPITLLEYGKALGLEETRPHETNIFVGAHYEYQRRFDLIEQTRHVKTFQNKKVHMDLYDVLKEYKNTFRKSELAKTG